MRFTGLLMILILTGCGNQNSEDKQVKADSSVKTTTAEKKSTPEKVDGLEGEWELVGVTEDINGNDQLESDERNKASNNAMDYMKLNNDGSAEFFVSKTKGIYEVRTNESTGRKHLYLYDQGDFQYSKGYIMTLTDNELQIMLQSGGNSITIWKREVFVN